MQREQKVCEQEVIIGVVKKSLQTRHRRELSSGERLGSGAGRRRKSEGSVTVGGRFAIVER